MSDKLRALIEQARRCQMTPAEIEEQRISFAFGNANYEDQRVTRQEVVRALQSLRRAVPFREEDGILCSRRASDMPIQDKSDERHCQFGQGNEVG